jgi:hypothetical protein
MLTLGLIPSQMPREHGGNSPDRENIAIDKSLYDLRYFYFDGGNVGRWTCGVAFEALLAVYRQFKARLSDGIGPWYTAISISPNPTVLGYLVEYVCLATIERDGLGIADKELGHPLEKEYFDDIPRVDNLIASASSSTRRLYIPTTFNFPDIDAAIVRLDRGEKKAYVCLIQVTVAKDHKDSEANFYLTKWEKWENQFKANGYSAPSASSTFVWIDRGEPRIEDVSGETKLIRTRVITTKHEHTRMNLSIKILDSPLDDVIAKAVRPQ